jgi:hypothetical protein
MDSQALSAMEALKIVLLATLASVLYGIAHDQVTARVCLEYFTIGHPPVFDTQSPTLLALGWGVIATWWVGVPLGIALALAARAGRAQRWSACRCLRPIAFVLGCMAIASAVAGVAGYVRARSGAVWLLEPLASRVPPARHALFLADLWAHTAAYAVGLVGGALACGWIAISRAKSAGAPLPNV